MIGALFVAVVGAQLLNIKPNWTSVVAQWPAFVTLCLISPVIEEMVFRGYCQRYLATTAAGRKSWLWISAANMLTTGLFVLTHALMRDGMNALLVVLPSLYLGVIMDRIGSLRLCMLVHALWNLIWFVLVYPLST